jgi:hypothetical protein
MQTCGDCAYCGGDNENLVAVTDQEHPPAYTIECIRCDAMGPWALSLEGAVKAWRNSKS